MLWNMYDLADPIATVHVNAVCVVRFCHAYGDHGRDSSQDMKTPALSASTPLSTPVKQYTQSPYASTQSQLSSTQTRFYSTQPPTNASQLPLSATQPASGASQLQSPLRSSQYSSQHSSFIQSPSTPLQPTYTAQSMPTNPPISPLHPLPDTSNQTSLQLNSLDSFQGIVQRDF